MIGLKSGMIRPNHANKWYDFAKKTRLRQRSGQEIVCFKEKAPAATLTTKNTFFVAKKGPAATFTIQKMHFCTDIGASKHFFKYF